MNKKTKLVMGIMVVLIASAWLSHQFPDLGLLTFCLAGAALILLSHFIGVVT